MCKDEDEAMCENEEDDDDAGGSDEDDVVEVAVTNEVMAVITTRAEGKSMVV